MNVVTQYMQENPDTVLEITYDVTGGLFFCELWVPEVIRFDCWANTIEEGLQTLAQDIYFELQSHITGK